MNLLRLTPQLLIEAYSQGVFPMARSRTSRIIEWFCSNPRAVLPLNQFRCPRSLRATLRKNLFDIRMDTSFEQVMQCCSIPRATQTETWINPEIIASYTQLHHMGHAHSIEAWRNDQLVGGLYGVSLGGAFFGESMFHRPDLGGTDASKVCFAVLVHHLIERGYVLLDVQMTSSHMAQFGVVTIPLDVYLQQLEHAIQLPITWSANTASAV